jgi:hypothetical protein
LWKVLVEKLGTNPTMTTSSKPKGKDEVGPSTKTNSLASNTRKVVVHTQAYGSSTVSKRPRRTKTVPEAEVQGDAKNGKSYWTKEEGEQMTKSGVQPSPKKITAMHVEETHKNIKYTKKAPIITLIEDYVELVVDKVQDRG